MAFDVLNAVWKARELDGRRITLAEKAVIARIADFVRLDTGLAWISLNNLAADCSLTKPGAIGVMKRVTMHAAPAQGPCQICGAPSKGDGRHGCIQVVTAHTGTRAKRYRILVERLRGKGGLPLAGSTEPSVKVNAVGLGVNGSEPNGQAGLPDPDVPEVPEKDYRRSAPGALSSGKKFPAVFPAKGSDVWSQILARVTTRVTQREFFTWFVDAALVEDDGCVARVKVPSEDHKKWLERHHASKITEALAEIGRLGTRVHFVVDVGRSLPIRPALRQAAGGQQ